MRPKRVGEIIYIYIYMCVCVCVCVCVCLCVCVCVCVCIYNTLKLLYVFLLFIAIDYKRCVNVLEKSERDEGTETKKERTKWGDN